MDNEASAASHITTTTTTTTNDNRHVATAHDNQTTQHDG
jgi:hypothetical protein